MVDALLDSGRKVRAVVRAASSGRARALQQRGVELAAADISDVDALSDALQSAAGVFAMTTPFEDGEEAELAQGRAVVAAAAKAAVPHLVFSSVASADRETGIPHFETKATTERLLAQSGVPYTIVGPTYFYDNILGGIDDVKSGRLDLAIGVDTPLQQLSRRDLGRFILEVFADPATHFGARIDIASDAPTPREMAATLTRTLQHDVTAHPHDPAEIGSADMRAMFTFLGAAGYSADIPTLHSRYPDVGWQSFDQWVGESIR
ncbi:NmrA/HSCARG family protein [soil metagenome]